MSYSRLQPDGAWIRWLIGFLVLFVGCGGPEVELSVRSTSPAFVGSTGAELVVIVDDDDDDDDTDRRLPVIVSVTGARLESPTSSVSMTTLTTTPSGRLTFRAFSIRAGTAMVTVASGDNVRTTHVRFVVPAYVLGLDVAAAKTSTSAAPTPLDVRVSSTNDAPVNALSVRLGVDGGRFVTPEGKGDITTLMLETSAEGLARAWVRATRTGTVSVVGALGSQQDLVTLQVE